MKEYVSVDYKQVISHPGLLTPDPRHRGHGRARFLLLPCVGGWGLPRGHPLAPLEQPLPAKSVRDPCFPESSPSPPALGVPCHPEQYLKFCSLFKKKKFVYPLSKSLVRFVCKRVTFLLLLRNTIFSFVLLLMQTEKQRSGRSLPSCVPINKPCLFLYPARWFVCWLLCAPSAAVGTGCRWHWSPYQQRESTGDPTRRSLAGPAGDLGLGAQGWLSTWEKAQVLLGPPTLSHSQLDPG